MSPFDARLLLNVGNKYQLGNSGVNEYSEGNVTGLAAPENIVGYYGKNVSDEIEKSLAKSENYFVFYSKALQAKYGTMDINYANAQITNSVIIGGGLYSTSSISPKGGGFLDNKDIPSFDWVKTSQVGSITDAIRNYNLARNLYNTQGVQLGSLDSVTIFKANNDEGFQDLIAQTIGDWSGNKRVGSQRKSNLTPASVIIANNGAYIGSPENLLRPEQGQGMEIGSAASMMAQTVPGNSLMDTEFKAGNRGVKYIMRTIRNGEVSTVGFAKNYDVQNEKKYIIGMNGDGSPKVARQKFTIANPYRPGNAKSVLFYLENFSSEQRFYFPPYIHSYSDSYGANWNEIHFLGRPEPIFTYNNSSREGTISFIVLTDYSQGLTIGTDYNSDSLGPVTINNSIRNFTDNDVARNKSKQFNQEENLAQQQVVINTIQQQTQIIDNGTSAGANNSSDEAVASSIIADAFKDLHSLEKSLNIALANANSSSNYSETNPINGNVNTLLITKRSGDSGDGDIDTKAEDSVKRINEMIKSLAFQPSFFSGDKVDFKTKMDFLAKLTRPAKADQCSGFSFTKPPVCRIRLGDWWNNDIVVSTVNFSYEDSPWTLDDTGVVQPMWATVSMNFKFVGPFGGQSGSPVLSDDVGGFYGPRI